MDARRRLGLAAEQDHAPRLLDVRELRHGEHDRGSDRGLHLCQSGAGRIGDRDQEIAVAAKADRNRGEPQPDLGVETGGSAQVDRDVLDVDVVDPVLRREPASEILGEEPAALDQDLAEPLPAARLLTQRVVELLGCRSRLLSRTAPRCGRISSSKNEWSSRGRYCPGASGVKTTSPSSCTAKH